jgi:hypothetical protein
VLRCCAADFVSCHHRFGHGSDFSKLASSEQEEQTDYVVGVSPHTFSAPHYCVINFSSPVFCFVCLRYLIFIDLGSFILHYFSLHLMGRCEAFG